MDEKKQEELALLFARMDDLAGRAKRGEVAISPFLSPRESRAAMEHVRRQGARVVPFGGASDVERVRLYLLPEYMEEPSSDRLVETLSDFGFESGITPLLIEGSGFCRLTHRDFLGSLLGLGLARSVLGDLLLMGEGEKSAVLFCDSAIASFLLETPVRVARDAVKIRRLREDELASASMQKKTQPLHDTVASPRLDCVVAALCGLSREKARGLIESGLVCLEYEEEERPDRMVTSPAVLSVRGYGRYRVLSLSEQTKKGRIRLLAEKYV